METITYQIDHAVVDRDLAINTLLDQFCRWSKKNQIHEFTIDYPCPVVSSVTIKGTIDLAYSYDELRMPENRTAKVRAVVAVNQPIEDTTNRIESDVNKALDIIQGKNQ